MSLSNALNIGKTALANAQISINTASNNIANSETEGYQSVTTTYSSTSSISVSGNSLGTGADVSLETNWNSFVEKQYLSASADLASSTAVSDYLSQLDAIFNQSEDEGLAAAQDEFLSAWSDLSTYPDSLAEREALLGEAESLVYSLNSIASDLEDMSEAVSSEIVDQVATANELIDSIALLNEQIAASPDNTELISSRDQAIRELDEIIGVEVITSSDGTTKIYTESGQPLVEGTETHSLVYSSARSTESLQPTSTYDGDIEFSGTSSEEILIEFVSSGADGTAQFKVSLDGGETWEEDENGNTLLYTAGDSDNAVTIAGVEISFSGTNDHTTGDRYTVVAKTGLYWENSSGGLVNITPMTDESGSDVNNRTSSGSLAGLFKVRDDYIEPFSDELDDYTEALIWEVNSAHSQGAGLESHSAVEGTYSVDDQTAALSNCGLVYEDKITSGEFSIYTYDADGNLASNASISVDPATDSLDDIVTAINTAFSGSLTASVNSDGELEIQAATDTTFEFGEDTSGIIAALGINTFFDGSTAEDISINSYVSSDTSHINAGVVDADDGTVSSGSNETAEAINDLLSETVSIGEGVSATDTSLTEYLAALVAEVGAAASTAETQVTCDTTTAELYYDLQESGSGVNVDEELINLTKYQQQYQAACQIIEVTREMIDSILDIV